ncbi:RdgB/HAM1 family non-canonical purine NTP pyrophosphatase [Miniphocaeibacter massiliensis]|uniref:RdgB/HAM1 family non-canonical purine NTP pyrophosphatase n=1 Tax=Miniphocaeibacter massiliensis TaxID=2041841 RepID=UPI000C086B34|nr:RdgB/HAM1 family non-canonical purine NTP pyrophosphatase [Miniphocaeibacter massiliensis]
MKRLVLASHNKGKIKEIKDILKNLDIEVLGISDIITIEDIKEDADTLEGNARIKAEYIHNKIGGYTLADDTGLFVEVLNGKPGVHTARFAGENCSEQENRDKLLEVLNNEKNRNAVFRTVLVLIDEKGKEYIVEGSCEGTISNMEIGEKGFGYDKLFIPKGYSTTFSEIGLEEKNLISHRAKALNKLKELLVDMLNEDSDY